MYTRYDAYEGIGGYLLLSRLPTVRSSSQWPKAGDICIMACRYVLQAMFLPRQR
jgi:hypothetical protein